MTKDILIYLFLKYYFFDQTSLLGGFSTSDDLPTLDFGGLAIIICSNNTPPASLLVFGPECSAPRGVTRFWGTEN